jgi:hypothetical protein
VAGASGTGAGSSVTVSAGGPVVVVTSTVPVPHGAAVTASGSATADLTFSHTSACALQPTGGAPGRLTTRIPPSALLQLTEGVVICTIPSVVTQVRLCGGGVVYANGTAQGGTQFVATCDLDPVFSVAVLNGSVKVLDPGGGTSDVGGNHQVACDPDDCQAEIGGTGFTDEQMAIFAAQSDELHWVPPTTTTTTTTTSTTATTSTSTTTSTTSAIP